MNGEQNYSERLSDKKLQHYKVLIIQKIQKIEEFLNNQKNSHINQNGTDDTGKSFEIVENGSTASSVYVSDIEVDRQEKLLILLNNALIRIGNKSYGVCRITGKIIPDERLNEVLHATTSIEGKKQEAEENRKKNLVTVAHQLQNLSSHRKRY